MRVFVRRHGYIPIVPARPIVGKAVSLPLSVRYIAPGGQLCYEHAVTTTSVPETTVKPLIVGIGGTTRLKDTRSDKRVYFDGMAVGVVVTAAGWQALGSTLGAARSVVAAMRGWATPVGTTVNTLVQTVFDGEGGIVDPDIMRAIDCQARQVMYLAATGAGRPARVA